MQREEKSVIVDFGIYQKGAFAPIMPKSIGEKFRKCFLQKLWINIQTRVAGLNVPGNFGAFRWEIAIDLRAQVFHEIGGPVRDLRG